MSVTEPAVNVLAVRRRGQLRTGTAAIAVVHADYPTFSHVFPKPRRRAAHALHAFLTATVRHGIAFASTRAVRYGPGINTAAVWLRPGAFPWSMRRKLVATHALTRGLVADPRAFPTFVHCGANVKRAHPAEPHRYLEVLSVHPEHQRQRLGSRYLTPILERTDRDGMPSHLETADAANVDFYQPFGFHVVDRRSWSSQAVHA